MGRRTVFGIMRPPWMPSRRLDSPNNPLRTLWEDGGRSSSTAVRKSSSPWNSASEKNSEENTVHRALSTAARKFIGYKKKTAALAGARRQAPRSSSTGLGRPQPVGTQRTAGHLRVVAGDPRRAELVWASGTRSRVSLEGRSPAERRRSTCRGGAANSRPRRSAGSSLHRRCPRGAAKGFGDPVDGPNGACPAAAAVVGHGTPSAPA